MSSAVVVRMASPPMTLSLGSSTIAQMPSTGCPNCGDTTLLPSIQQAQTELVQAHTRIAELEAQVRALNQKAVAAADRWADYEDELTRLRKAPGAEDDREAPPPPPPKPSETLKQGVSQQPSLPPSHLARSQSLLQSSTNRISQFLSRSMTAPTAVRPAQQQHPLPPDQQRPNTSGGVPQHHHHQTTEGLLEALKREQHLRRQAEGKLTATSLEVEELSASLFEQANEMVADERRARAKLEERVDELERRDKEKRRRLERLEAAMVRIERVKTLLEA